MSDKVYDSSSGGEMSTFQKIKGTANILWTMGNTILTIWISYNLSKTASKADPTSFANAGVTQEVYARGQIACLSNDSYARWFNDGYNAAFVTENCLNYDTKWISNFAIACAVASGYFILYAARGLNDGGFFSIAKAMDRPPCKFMGICSSSANIALSALVLFVYAPPIADPYSCSQFDATVFQYPPINFSNQTNCTSWDYTSGYYYSTPCGKCSDFVFPNNTCKYTNPINNTALTWVYTSETDVQGICETYTPQELVDKKWATSAQVEVLGGSNVTFIMDVPRSNLEPAVALVIKGNEVLNDIVQGQSRSHMELMLIKDLANLAWSIIGLLLAVCRNKD